MGTELNAALARLQGQLPHIPKGETGKVEGTTKDGRKFSYTYSYADLHGVSAAVLPLMSECGLAFTALPTLNADGKFVLAYSLLHSSGEHLDGEYLLPDPARATQQQIGGVITYARRYCLCAVTGVAPAEDDDDAQKASKAEPQQERPALRQPQLHRPERQERQRPPVRGAGELPRNQDGSISRSQATEEEKDAAGLMTDAQQREHTKLGGGGGKSSRDEQERIARGAAQPDIWSNGGGPEQPRGNVRDIIRHLERLEVTDREERLVYTAQLAHRDPIDSTNDLTAAERSAVLRRLEKLRDHSQLVALVTNGDAP